VKSIAIYLLFFLSGISGLIYQVIWVREFGFVFGNTVFSASTITAVFMCGLGVGSFVVGRWSDRHHGEKIALPLRAYGFFEIGIAVLGALLALILPELESFSASFTNYQLGPEGWFEVSTASHLLRFVTAVLLLAPSSFLMGGTLTLLVRYLLLGNISSAGWRIGALYGLNTAGAALGAFFTDFSLVPQLGIMGAQIVAVLLNAVAGIGALLLARQEHQIIPAAREVTTDRSVLEGWRSSLVVGTSLTLFISGFVAMGFEILWFRYLINGLMGLRAVFSLLLTVILIGIFMGSVIGGFLERRFGNPARLYLFAQTAVVISALAPLAFLGPNPFLVLDPKILLTLADSSSLTFRLTETAINLQSIVVVVGLPALFMGCTFPLSNAHVQRVEAEVGNHAGALYLANTMGAVVGSLLTGFVLLPWLGQQDSAALLATCGAAGLIPLYLTVCRRSEHREWVPAGLVVRLVLVLLVCIGLWQRLPPQHLLKFAHESDGNRVLAVSEGINENLVIADNGKARTLYTNGHAMSGTEWAGQRYMSLFSHIPLLSAENPERVLVICFGVGTTLYASSLHPSIKEIEVADLSKNVVSHGNLFSRTNGNVLKDPRTSVFINDGRQHLRMQPVNSYDLITLEPPPIAFAGVASLYSNEFYSLARSRLRQGGSMTQWLPAYQVPGNVTLSIIRSFLDVFPNAVLLSGYGSELILVGSKGSEAHMRLDRVRSRLREDSPLRRDLEKLALSSPADLAATFVAGPAVLERVTRGLPSVTDDRPMMEYSMQSNYTVKFRIPEVIFDSSEWQAWCPECFDGDEPISEMSELPSLFEALNIYYKSDFYLNHSSLTPRAAPPTKDDYREDPCLLDTVRENIFFSAMFQCLASSSLDPGREAVIS